MFENITDYTLDIPKIKGISGDSVITPSGIITVFIDKSKFEQATTVNKLVKTQKKTTVTFKIHNEKKKVNFLLVVEEETFKNAVESPNLYILEAVVNNFITLTM
jgi:hypothetical protein